MPVPPPALPPSLPTPPPTPCIPLLFALRPFLHPSPGWDWFPSFLHCPLQTLTSPSSIPCGARTPWRPCVPMATAVTSLWARLTTPVRSPAVAKGTGGCRESGKGAARGGGRHRPPKAPTSLGRSRPRESSRGARGEGREGAAPFRRPPAPVPFPPPLRPRNGLARAVGRCAAASAPPRRGPAP